MMTLRTINNQLCTVIALSIVLMLHSACGRQDIGGGGGRRMPPQVLLNELLTNANEEALYSELKKYHRQQPNYLSKWPGLRDLLLTADYDDIDNDGYTDNESNEISNSRFMERLRQLAASTVEDLEDAREESLPEMLPTAMPLRKLSPAVANTKGMSFKDHGTKKNAQYMSPCHFKICNMGRKRNARFFGNN